MRNCLAVDFNHSRVRLFSARQNLHQRRFACAIFTNESVNFSFGDVETDVLQGFDPGVAL
jgi:hypothetical protein